MSRPGKKLFTYGPKKKLVNIYSSPALGLTGATADISRLVQNSKNFVLSLVFLLLYLFEFLIPFILLSEVITK